ncbi:MAG: LytTR family transcriptional regulator DNA-binding domain-containing protein [Saprospiraceae bacterium]|nr:LytTR family transcriptional regulator DNA-binding domain-containing protein [Saprospiraceae bacterium]
MGKASLLQKTLKYWIIRLGALDPVFERIHRSFLINRNHILSYNSIEKCFLMTGNRTVKVARRQKIQL